MLHPSVNSSDFKKAKTFVINFTKEFNISNRAVQISAFAFDDKVQGGFYFKNFSTEQDISTAIQNIVYTSGGTNFDIPLTFAREQMFLPQNGARGKIKKILIFITDGDTTVTDEPGHLLRDMDVTVYTIGVGTNVNNNNLDKIATSVKHQYIALSFSLINNIKQNLTSQACKEIGEHYHPCNANKTLCNFGNCGITGTTNYTCYCYVGYTGNHCESDINECEGVTCLNQGTCIDYIGYFTCKCRQFLRTLIVKQIICEPSAADIVFVIDVSASMSSKLLNHAKDHAELTTKEWHIDTNHFHIALVTVAESANTNIGFSNIATKWAFLNVCIKSEQADVIILVDLSGIQQNHLNSIVPTSLVKILSKIRLGTNDVKLALVTFSDQASTRFNFNAYSENNRLDLQRSLSSYEAVTDKSSNILEAIKLAEALLGDPTEGARSSAKKVILVISEFKNSLNEQDLRYAEELRNNGINIHTIGIFPDGNAFDTMSGLASTSYHIVCQDPADIGFLLDASGSVVSSEFEKVKTFAINFIKKFDISNQAVKISAFAFDAEVKGGFHFNHFSTEQDISTGIRGIVYTGGGTSFDIPLTFAREQMFLPQNGARGYTKKILIFITDGDAPTTDEPGQLLRDMGVAVYAIGVGSNLNTNNLDKIATSVNHRYMVLSFSLINNIKDTLTSKACKEIGEHAKDHPCKTNTNLCNFGICRITGTTSFRCVCDFGYTGNHCETDINECEGVICLNQGTCVDHIGYFTCNCRQYYEGTYCETNICEPVAVNVVFVIDVSASMDSKFLNHAKDHTELTTKEWQIDDYHFQIALVTVAKSANTVLGFSHIATKDDLRNGITNLNLKNEPSNVHLGLSKAFELFNIKGRSNVKKRIILYSDGLPSNPSALEQTLSYLQHYSNIEIYTVAIGIDVSHYFLSRISRDVSNVFPYNTDALWHHIMQNLIKPECNGKHSKYLHRLEQADVIIMVDLAGIQQDYLNLLFRHH
ncbi:COL6A [Mytilus edulis]|uniref:COL6A n=1 Tax=Mytilus edulis TaxID=6550 RepID=A0A8S3SW24_MYTED|nr:COL6A [Mytilus edulis]